MKSTTNQMDYQRSKKSDKAKKTFELYGKNSKRASRMIEAIHEKNNQTKNVSKVETKN
jgi:hypothetical protein